MDWTDDIAAAGIAGFAAFVVGVIIVAILGLGEAAFQVLG